MRRLWPAALALLACAFTIDLSPHGWKMCCDSAALSTSPDGGVNMAFPIWPKNIGYLYRQTPADLAGTLVVEFRVETIGAPIFRWDTEPTNTCPVPAMVRPVFGRWDRGNKNIAFAERWWSKNPYSYTLAAGVATIAVPMDPLFWSGVYGQSATDDFAAWEYTRHHAGLVGVTFGGGCFFAHGVGVEGGTAAFVLTRWEAQ